MKKIILICSIVCSFIVSITAQIGTSGSGSGSGNGGSGSGGSSNGSGMGINISVNRNTPVNQSSILDASNFGGGTRGGGPNNDTDRKVFWIHGLNGDGGTWSRAATASTTQSTPIFPARKLYSAYFLDYTQSGSPFEAATSLDNQMYAFVTNQTQAEKKNNFLICHSQGGIVGRSLMNKYFCGDIDQKAGGIVTVCTPNQGAMVINNKLLFSNLSQDMCKSLSEINIIPNIDKTFRLGGLKINTLTKIPTSTILDSFCTSFLDTSGFVFKYVTGIQTPPITNYFKVGSSFLDNININCPYYNDSIPKVAFYGVEPQNALMLRTLQYFTLTPNSYEYFESNEDSIFIKSFQKDYDNYVQLRDSFVVIKKDIDFWYNVYCSTWWDRLANFGICHNLIVDAVRADSYINASQKAIDWFSRFDDQYKTIIGALSYDTTSTIYYKCICNQSDGQNYSEYEVDSPQECYDDPNNNNGGITCYTQGPFTRYNYTANKKESDGVVLAESAMNLPKATSFPVLLDNTSHMQARNNEEIRKALFNLYEGNSGTYFFTAQK